MFIAGALGAAHAGRVTLLVQDLRLVENVMNVINGQPDGATQEEMRGHLDQDGGAPRGARLPPPLPPPSDAPPPPWGAPHPGGAQCWQPASRSGFGYGQTDPGIFRDGQAGLWETGFPKKKPGLA